MRHGQSTYNEAISGPGSWDEPNIFDAPLTKLGARAKGLGAFFRSSPRTPCGSRRRWTRAMEACVHGQVLAGGGGAKEEGRGDERGRGRRRQERRRRGQAAVGARGRGKSRLARRRKEARGRRVRASDEQVRGWWPRAGRVGAGSRGRAPRALWSRRWRREPASARRAAGSPETNGACDEQTPAPATLRGWARTPASSGRTRLERAPSETLEPDAAEMSSWGERVIVHPHLSEKLATSGDIGRCKGVLMNEFPLLGLSLSRLPGDVWWYNRPHHPNDARRLLPVARADGEFKERVATFRHWLMSREDKTFVVFGHSTFFKELVGGNRSLKNCEVHTYHL